MKAESADTAQELKPGEIRVDRILGRSVVAANNRPVGRLEELRADRRGAGIVITGIVIGAAGLFERLGLGAKLLFGKSAGGHLARWDQVDFSNPAVPRLTCPLEELEEL